MQILRETGELPYRFVITIRRHRDIVGGAANVDTGGVGMSDRQGRPGFTWLEADFGITLGHHILHKSEVKWGTASGTSSCSLSQTGYPFSGCTPPSGFTNVDDVTQDHAHVRA